MDDGGMDDERKTLVSASKGLRGIIVPMVTPFKADEDIDWQALSTNLEYLIRHKVHGLFPLGSQGEFHALSLREKKQLIDFVTEKVSGRILVVVGASGITTRESIELSQHTERAGADVISILTPFFITPNQAELREHYLRIAEKVSIPILAYNNPSRTGVNLLPATMAAIAEEASHVVGIKDSSGNLGQTAEYIRLCPATFRTFIGRDTLVYAGLMYGCAGAVAATANVVPGLVVSIYEAVQEGDHKQARDLQRQLSRLRYAFRLGTFPVVVKEAMELAGLPAGPARSPIQPLGANARQELRGILEELGALTRKG